MARQTWAEMETEVLTRMAKQNDSTTYSPRVQRALEASYRQVCHLFKHRELEQTATGLVLSTSAPTLSISAVTPEVFIPTSFDLLDVSSVWIKTLLPSSFASILQARKPASAPGEPEQFSLYGETLQFDRTSDVAYRGTLYYLAKPTTPVFTGSNYPDIDDVWDEPIMQYAVLIASGNLGYSQASGSIRQVLQDFLQGSPETRLGQARIGARTQDAEEREDHIG